MNVFKIQHQTFLPNLDFFVFNIIELISRHTLSTILLCLAAQIHVCIQIKTFYNAALTLYYSSLIKTYTTLLTNSIPYMFYKSWNGKGNEDIVFQSLGIGNWYKNTVFSQPNFGNNWLKSIRKIVRTGMTLMNSVSLLIFWWQTWKRRHSYP